MLNRSGFFIAIVALVVLGACSPAVPVATPLPPTAVAAVPTSVTVAKPVTSPVAATSVAQAVASGTDAEWGRIVEAAKKEGKVVIYGSFEQTLQDIYIPAFKKDYPGIEVEVVFGTGPGSAEKIRAEVAAGKVQADLWRSFTDPALALRDQGNLEKWQAPTLVRERDKFAYLKTDEDEQGYLNNVAATVTGVMVNTKQLKAADFPTSWFDLKDPKYKSLMILNDPRVPSGGQSMAWFIAQKYGTEGEAFLKALGQQDMQYEASAPKLAEEVARGERPMAWPVQWASFLANQTPDVKFIQPKEGLYYSMANTVIPRGAPHPNAAKVWTEWEVSKAGQQVKADAGRETAIRNDVTTKETWLRLDTAGAWASVTFSDRRSKQEEMQRTVKAYFPN